MTTPTNTRANVPTSRVVAPSTRGATPAPVLQPTTIDVHKMAAVLECPATHDACMKSVHKMKKDLAVAKAFVKSLHGQLGTKLDADDDGMSEESVGKAAKAIVRLHGLNGKRPLTAEEEHAAHVDAIITENSAKGRVITRGEALTIMTERTRALSESQRR